jgi:hypothetical protein
MQRRMDAQAADLSDQDIAVRLQQGEQALNELRETDPELAESTHKMIFDGIREAHRRWTTHGVFRPRGAV